MRMTVALFGLLIFASLLSLGGFDVFATDILDLLDVLTPDSWSSRLVTLTAAAILTAATVFFGGQSALTFPAVAFMIGVLAAPTAVVTSSTMPSLIKVLIGGFWLFFLISGVGAALRGEF